jgi:hypothetical protein
MAQRGEGPEAAADGLLAAAAAEEEEEEEEGEEGEEEEELARPTVGGFAPRPLRCSVCQEAGHNRRTCPQRPQDE